VADRTGPPSDRRTGSRAGDVDRGRGRVAIGWWAARSKPAYVKAGVVIAIELWWIGSYALPTLAAARGGHGHRRAIRLAVTRRTVNIPPRLSWSGAGRPATGNTRGIARPRCWRRRAGRASRSTCSA